MLAAVLIVAGGCRIDGDDATASGHVSYRVSIPVDTTIRIWASPEDRVLLEALQDAFTGLHPDAAFDNRFHGTESSFAGIYTDVADAALMDREMREPMERMAYQWVKLGRPLEIEFARGSLDRDRPSSQITILVHKDNPLSELTLSQLDAVLGADRLRGAEPVSTWADLGVEGPLATEPIRVYGPAIDTIAAQFVRRLVMEDSRKWSASYHEQAQEQDAIERVAEDRTGLALAPFRLVDKRVKPVALARDGTQAASQLDASSIIDGSYPLVRSVRFSLPHTQTPAERAPIAEFLRFVLSSEGQRIIADDRGYLPLDAASAARQLERLINPIRSESPAAVAAGEAASGDLRKVGPDMSSLEMHALPPPYLPDGEVSGSIRIWGHGSYGAHTDFVEALTRAWQDGFRRHHPDVVFDNRLHGTASAIGALYTDTGDIAFLGREIWQPEITAFHEVKGYAPTGIDVLTGSFDVRNKGYAISVFVHKDNPLDALDLAQLEAVYGLDRKRGHAQVRTWGDLGVGGEWKDRPVQIYGLPIARGFAEYFQDAVFLGGRRWKTELREFPDEPGSRGGETDGGHKMLQAMADDPLSIGYAGMLYQHPNVKAIAIAPAPGAPAVMPTLESVADHSYPLTRFITMFVDRAPGQPLDPKVRAFLHYILSEEGQQAVLNHGQGYLPVPREVALREARKLD